MSLEALSEKLGDRLLRDANLARFTAARMGGNADWLYQANTSVEELVEVLTAAWDENLPVRVLGGGANVLVADSGVRGLVVISRLTGIKRDGRFLTVESGTPLTVLSRNCQKMGLAGFEWAVAVPGTIGGAVVNNAGAHGSDMAMNLVSAEIVEANRGVLTLTRQDLQYNYRASSLKLRTDKRFLVLRVLMEFREDDPAAIQARMDTFNAHRRSTQPGGASLGSIFKNPPNDYAGRLIEAAGLKGYRIGSAMVSPVHANFFINVEGAEGLAADYYALVRHVQQTVEAQFGVRLEPEIEFVGEF